MKGRTKVLIGAAIGGILGVLFAPSKGKKTRKKIAAIQQKLKRKFGKEVTMEESLPTNE